MSEKLTKIIIEIDDCTKCAAMQRVPDPDPNDGFNDDDEKFVCGKTGQVLSSGNRPYEKQPIPESCPELTK